LGTCVDRLDPTKRDEMSQLAGQTVVVIGGSAGMGLETARLAAPEGVITGPDPERLALGAADIGARSTAITVAGFDIDGGRQFVT
jgi:NAD(P)-dependent dehydrogenase (short-subunit alcohol dehydrogenase family)